MHQGLDASLFGKRLVPDQFLRFSWRGIAIVCAAGPVGNRGRGRTQAAFHIGDEVFRVSQVFLPTGRYGW